MFSIQNISKLILIFILFNCFSSCNKDVDLLSEYSLDEENFEDAISIRDDIFKTNGNPIILDVLSNDLFPDSTKVRITGISNPNLGTVYIREDNTIVYTPSNATSETSSEDSNSEEGSSSNTDTDSTNNDTSEETGNNSTDNQNSDDSTDSEETADTTQNTGADTNDSDSEDASDTSENTDADTNTDNNDSEETSDTAENTDTETNTEETDSGGTTDTAETEDTDTSDTDTNTDSSTEEDESTESESETQSDTFTYTTETENEDGTTTTEEGTVTVEYEEEEDVAAAEESSSTEEETSTEEDEENCTPHQIIPEYRLNGVWSSGQNELSVAYGTEVALSMLPNNIDVAIQLPDGTVVGDDFVLGSVTPENNGAYILTSAEGCTTVINLTVAEEIEQEATAEVQSNIADNARFVSAYGNNFNDGLSESTPWSIAHAFRAVQAGQTVYVRAGDYGNQILILRNSGSAGNPIRFKGYQNVPEDIQAQNGSTFNYGDNLDAGKMPLFSGSAPSGRGTGIAMRIDGDHIELSNLQFTQYEMGIINNSSNLTYDNIVISKVGDFRAGISGFGDYSGIGIRTTGSYNKITNSIVVNAGAEALILSGCDNCEISNSKVYADDETNPTDYYLLMNGGTTNSRITNCIATRRAGLSHFGHGIILKAGANNNSVSNSTVINTNIELSFEDVYENTIENCAVIGRWNQDSDLAGGILVANGAHHNTFKNINVDGVYGGLRFMDWLETGSGLPNDGIDAGNNNQFINVTVSNSRFGIDFNEFQKREGSAWNNTFSSCTFRNLNFLININRPNSGTTISGCSIENTVYFSETSPGFDYQLNSNTILENNTYVNVGFSRRD